MKPLVVGRRPTLRFNLLIVGPSGLGKRTFLKTLFQSYVGKFDFTGDNTHKAIVPNEFAVFNIDGDTSDVEFHVFESKGFGMLHFLVVFFM